MTFIDFLTGACIIFFIIYFIVLNIGEEPKENEGNEPLAEKKRLFKQTDNRISIEDFENKYFS